ncbi:MAG TPA: TetR/AcrR family transcriptional regulator [Kineosporiaceae bacterium]
MTFQRARSEEQREIRRRAILDSTAAMLNVMPVQDVTLNGLSRRVGLAKSNVLRYFESREAILLELLDRAGEQWLSGLADELAAEIDPDAPARERGDRLAAVIARSVAGQHVLCDLLSAQCGVLEHNVSVEVAVRYKRATHAHLASLAELARHHVPELDEPASLTLSGLAIVTVGALWARCQPSASVLAAYACDPALAAARMPFREALEDALALLVAGSLARAGT